MVDLASLYDDLSDFGQWKFGEPRLQWQGPLNLIVSGRFWSSSRKKLVPFLSYDYGLAAGPRAIFIVHLSFLFRIIGWYWRTNRVGRLSTACLTITSHKTGFCCSFDQAVVDKGCSEIDFYFCHNWPKLENNWPWTMRVNMKSNIDDFALANLLNCKIVLMLLLRKLIITVSYFRIVFRSFKELFK